MNVILPLLFVLMIAVDYTDESLAIYKHVLTQIEACELSCTVQNAKNKSGYAADITKV